jgi:chromatin modification-related protein YNG2
MLERRLGSQTSIKLPSPAPAQSVGVGGAGYARSRLSRQIHPPRAVDDGGDAEGEEEEGEEEEGEGDDVEDKQIYCFCQKLSYGEVRLSSFAFFSTTDARSDR